MLVILIALLSLAGWSELDAPGFKVLYQPGMESYARDILKQAPGAKSLLEEQLHRSFDQPVSIVISASAEFGKIQPGSPPEWASATAYPEKNLIFLKPLARADVEDVGQTFLHELAHLLIYQRLNGRPVPHWFDEGMAVLASGEFSFDRFRILAQIGISGQYLRFSELDQGFPFNTNLAQLAYLESEDMVSFIMDTLGPEKYGQLLDRIAAGDDFYAALAKLSGMPFNEMEKNWLHRLRYRYGLALALGGSGSLWFLVSVLFLAAYIVKRRKTREIKREFETEEQMYRMGRGDDEHEYEEDDEESGGRNTWH